MFSYFFVFYNKKSVFYDKKRLVFYTSTFVHLIAWYISFAALQAKFFFNIPVLTGFPGVSCTTEKFDFIKCNASKTFQNTTRLMIGKAVAVKAASWKAHPVQALPLHVIPPHWGVARDGPSAPPTPPPPPTPTTLWRKSPLLPLTPLCAPQWSPLLRCPPLPTLRSRGPK